MHKLGLSGMHLHRAAVVRKGGRSSYYIVLCINVGHNNHRVYIYNY